MKPIIVDRRNVLKTGPLLKQKGAYQLALLTVAHIDAILELQDAVISSLAPQEKTYLIKKDRTFFERHFKNGNAVLGALHNGYLVAQSVVVNPTAANPKSGMVDMCLDATPDQITILQGVITHPSYRGNRLMTVMVDAWLEIAKNEGRIHALSEVDVNNHYSWSVFMKEGMELHSVGFDPADQATVYNMHADVPELMKRRLAPDFNAAAKRPTVECARSNLSAQKKLLSAGFRGVAFNQKTNAISFAPPANSNIQIVQPKRLP